MSEHIEKTIAEFDEKVREAERQTIEAKRMVNMLCGHANLAPRYPDAELTAQKSSAVGVIQGDQFHGKPLNTAVRDYLKMRRAGRLGPAIAEDIQKALLDGGFEFDAPTAASALHGLRISLGKSTHTFRRLPNGKYGLVVWYGPQKKIRKRAATDQNGAEDDRSENDGTDNGEGVTP